MSICQSPKVREVANVRFGSKADIGVRPHDVRFTPKSGHGWVQLQCPLCANSGHSTLILFDQFVGAAEQRHWNSEAERLGGLKVDD